MDSGTIRLDDEARARLVWGACGLAHAVKVTLGPRGRRVLINDGSGRPRITKDGAAVADSVRFADRYAELGASLVREAVRGTGEAAGDGSTTAAVLAHSLLIDGLNAVAAGVAPLALTQSIASAVERCCGAIRSAARPLNGETGVLEVATIAANGDDRIGRMLAAEIGAVGRDGLVLVEDGRTIEDSVERRNGMQFDQGFASRAFLADTEARSIELKKPLLCLADTTIETLDPLLPALDLALVAKRPLLLLAAGFGPEALAMLLGSRERGGLKVVAVRAPGFAARRTEFLDDLAVLTGGRVLTGGFAGARNLGAADLGRADAARITSGRTLIIGGEGRRADIETRCRWLREYANSKGDAPGSTAVRERLGRLTSGIATIRVGGATELERRERRERYESARRAAIAATGDGVVAGGGAALLHAARRGRADRGASVADRAGGVIVAQALTAPLRQIAANAGASGSTIAAHLVDTADPRQGFDAVRLDCADLLERGIVDPLTTVTTALRKAASVAGLVLGSHTIVLERPARKSARHPFACRCSEHDHAHYPGDPYHAHHHDHHRHAHGHPHHHQ